MGATDQSAAVAEGHGDSAGMGLGNDDREKTPPLPLATVRTTTMIPLVMTASMVMRRKVKLGRLGTRFTCRVNKVSSLMRCYPLWTTS